MPAFENKALVTSLSMCCSTASVCQHLVDRFISRVRMQCVCLSSNVSMPVPLQHRGVYFSLDNRRLWVFKAAKVKFARAQHHAVVHVAAAACRHIRGPIPHWSALIFEQIHVQMDQCISLLQEFIWQFCFVTMRAFPPLCATLKVRNQSLQRL